MAGKPLPDKVCQQAVALVAKYGSVNAASKAAGIPYSTFNRHFMTAQQRGLAADIVVTDKVGAFVSDSNRLPISVDECFALLDQWLGRKRIVPAKPAKPRTGGTQRIVIAGDFHAPFQDPQAVAALIENEAETTDTLVINGDLMDFYSISRFLKYERVPIEHELAATEALLAHLAGRFRDVLIISGNHDAPRFEKQLRGILAPEMLHVIEFLTAGNLSVIHALARRYSNVRFAPLKVGRFSVSWAAQIGDLVVTHAEKYSKVPGSALRGIDEWLTDQAETLGLAPWRVLVQAHTHQLGAFPWKADRMLVESGCLCATHGYMLTARIAGRAQRRGYVKLEQTNGVTDMNSVRFVWLDPVLRQTA